MKLSLVVPCYNEEANVRVFYEKVKEILCEIEYEIIYINDGSKDNTIKVLKDLFQECKDNLVIINFSRNFGKEAAMFAGLKKSVGEYVTIIDADLQQPIEVVKEMVDFLDHNHEYDEVAAYQEARKEGRILKAFKDVFYKLINSMSEVEFYKGASDFRTFRRPVVDAILRLEENFRFSKGIFSWVGFNVYYRPYEVAERNAGQSSWSFRKLFRYAVEGIVSFSTVPLKIATMLGGITSVLALIYMLVVIGQKIILGIEVPGYPTIIVLILLMGGIQLTVLGVLGEYLARVHIEVKNRPIFIEREFISYQEKS
ncbi:glycosyltransferase family 2 protein [Clostridium sp. AM58-1XD]|uniref:glycosyltransferase family 2 protein n=1 Tax=Clostridium sp. AM58-1XD TaxID=2292307 RepID=UPI000E48A98F|nr:glycosyltransferase family 2 protein [Clostridium sp. AM58-1XD]RGY98609.1 glycosyltransferase [Clostridium sp. AM58-1XD]